MNIFVLSKDPQEAARFHCNKHVVKMILESSQMLCTSHWMHLLESKGKKLTDFKRVRDAQQWLFENTPKEAQPPWKMSHVRHPCTIWTNKNISNYMWHLNLCESLLTEYTLRYKKNHKSEVVAKWLRKNIPVNIESAELTNFVVCMKDEYKIYQEDSRLDPVASYRNYYLKDKVRFAKWEPRANTPSWFKENKNEQRRFG
jgi:hypothetical protein